MSAFGMWAALIGVWVFALVIVLFILWWRSYNIPILVLRFVGNKGRPTMVITKGKKWFKKGVARLKVRGYKMPIRDFRSENYYPAHKKKYGGLIIWEFEDGYLTPCVPTKLQKDKGLYDNLTRLVQMFQQYQTVGFHFDREFHEGLKLKAVDDVDVDFMLQEYARIESQYQGGPWEFLNRYGGHMALIFISIMMLVGVVLFFKEAPDLARACAGAAKSSVSVLQSAADKVVPPG